MKNLVRTICAGALIGTLALTGCADKGKPTREQLTYRSVVVQIPGMEGKQILDDVDEDGLVDSIRELNGADRVFYVAKGYEKKIPGFVRMNGEYTKPMPKSIRASASKAIKAIWELGWDISDDKYGPHPNF